MDTNQENVKEFMISAGQITRNNPEIPTDEEIVLRIKLLFEEVLELAAASGYMVGISNSTHDEKKESISPIEEGDIRYIKIAEEPNLTEVADALTDIDYVNLGAACSYGIDLEPCQKEVHGSNMSKFIDGHRREDGKWVKGPSYRPADLKTVLDKQAPK